MRAHLRANLLLLLLTVGLCCVVYPIALLVIGQIAFPNQAAGSLVYNEAGQAVGSRLIAQPFTGAGYFQPRPSAVGYNAAASGASNWGASNPNLRKRVVGSLGPLLKYRDGRAVGPDIVAWVQERLRGDRKIILEWLKSDPYLAERWGTANLVGLTRWEKAHAAETANWHRAHPGQDITPADLATAFSHSFAAGTTKDWLKTDGTDLQIAFFELWWTAHRHADIEPIPGDMVMTSASGLDPHITLQAALYQLERVAASRAADSHQASALTKQEIEELLRERASAPLGGLAGVPLVNVLEVNLALDARYGSQPAKSTGPERH